MSNDTEVEGRCNAKCRDGGFCAHYPVKDDDTGDVRNGRCRMHGGMSTGPVGYQNALKHGLYCGVDGYHKALDEQEQAFLRELTETLLDRLEQTRGDEYDADMVDTELVKPIAIDIHKVAKANAYFSEQGMTQSVDKPAPDGSWYTEEKVNVWATEIRRHNSSIVERMQKLDILTPNGVDESTGDSLAMILSSVAQPA